MATVTDRLGEVLEREAPSWGIRPVPHRHRRLSGLDFAVLWGDLSVGLLVMVTGALLVPALGLRDALAAIAIGSAIGCLPLALVGYAGARERVPGMVLFRPVLGLRGSYVPSVLNFVQLIGWASFELWAMGRVANTVSVRLLGLDSYAAWVGIVAVICTALALGGPVLVVRRWLERFGVYLVIAVGAWITWKVLTAGDLGAAWRAPGEGGLPFWLAVDLVIVMPVSWLPLVADFNRFAATGVRSLAGTYFGYLAGNVWFYLLGVLLVLMAGAGPGVVDIGTSIASLAGGTIVLAVLLAGESDQAFANIYSSAVSVQNIRPSAPQRPLIAAVGVLGFLLAVLLRESAQTYEFFLFLIGSVFVPLFGVFAADYFVLRRARLEEGELFAPDAGLRGGIRWRALVPWLAGFVVYQWAVPTGPDGWVQAVEAVLHGWLRLPVPLLGSRVGASLPSFIAAFALALLVLRRQEPASLAASAGAR